MGQSAEDTKGLVFLNIFFKAIFKNYAYLICMHVCKCMSAQATAPVWRQMTTFRSGLSLRHGLLFLLLHYEL